MKKTCKGDNYSLYSGEGLSSYLSENQVDVIKKPIMITLLPARLFKKLDLDSVDWFTQMGMRYVTRERPSERYYMSAEDITSMLTFGKGISDKNIKAL